jgi:signal peptidase II
VRKIVNQTLVYVLAALVIFFDQYTKYLVRTRLGLRESWSPWPWLAPYARILHTENTGAAFGMFQSGGLIFAVIAVIVAVVIIVYAARLPEGHWWIRLTLGLQLGGALGNLIDRVMRGPVTDFVSVGPFYIFNVADASISIGVALLAVLMLIESRQPQTPPAPAAALADSGDAGVAEGDGSTPA